MAKLKKRAKLSLTAISTILMILAIIIIAQFIRQPRKASDADASLPAGYLYWVDFETNDYSQLTGPNTVYFSDGGLEGDDGAFFGKGVFWETKIVDQPAIGEHAASLSIGSGLGTAAYLFTYKFPSIDTASYQVDYYIPSNIQPSDWWNIWQWKSIDNNYDKPIIDLNLVRFNGVLQLRMSYVPNGNSTNDTQFVYQNIPIAFPINQFVNIRGVYTARADKTGSVKIYQDGQLVIEKTGIVTKPGDKQVLWSVNSYADSIGPNPAKIYVDNLIVKEGESEATLKPAVLPATTTPTPTTTPTTVKVSETNQKDELEKISPQFLTNSLPVGYRGESYLAEVVAIDDNFTDYLKIRHSWLPRGLKMGKCSQGIVDGQKRITCKIYGTPKTSTDDWLLSVSVRDNSRLKTQSKLLLVIE